MLNLRFWFLGVILVVVSSVAAATQRPTANIQDQYNRLKQVFVSMIKDGQIQLHVKPHNNSFNIFDSCSDKPMQTGSDYVGGRTDPSTTATLSDLAFEVVRLRVTLNKLGYPETAWKSILDQFESELLPLYIGQIGKPYSSDEGSGWQSIERTTTQFQNKILKKLADYRKQYAPTLPTIYYEQGNCGAGEISIHVRAEPSNGRVLFIPVFFHYLCKVEHKNPDDITDCDRWREPVDGQLFEVAGDYFYVAVWPDGARQGGRLSFTKLRDGQTVTFSKK
jgi:hypothetical protein